MEKALVRVKKERDSRKRKFLDIMGMLEEGSGKKRAVLLEEIGIDVPMPVKL